MRSAFNTQVQRREAVSAASNALEFAFDFMEQAFEDGQEMVVFVNELALGPTPRRFWPKTTASGLSSTAKLLLHGGEDELLAELQRDDVRGAEHSAEF